MLEGLKAVIGGETTKVEVKGTLSVRADIILMTRITVDLHRREKVETCLIVVSRVQFIEQDGKFTTCGGHVEV